MEARLNVVPEKDSLRRRSSCHLRVERRLGAESDRSRQGAVAAISAVKALPAQRVQSSRSAAASQLVSKHIAANNGVDRDRKRAGRDSMEVGKPW